jgi:hypothetical protein
MNNDDIRAYQRMMNNGRSWYCTDDQTRRHIELQFDFIASAMRVAYQFYVDNTSQSMRDYDYRTHVQRMRDSGPKHGKKKVLR